MSTRRRSNARIKNTKAAGDNIVQLRMIITFVVVILAFLVLAFRIGWIQVIASDTYQSKAKESQTKDEIIEAKRGSILDRNMKELAVSTVGYNVWLILEFTDGTPEMDAEVKKDQHKKVKSLLTDVLDMDKKTVKKYFASDNSRVKVAKNLTKTEIEKVKKRISDEGITIMQIEEDSTRNYPRESFASHVIGSVNSDGDGQSGIELKYNKYLSGIAGRWIKDTDRTGNALYVGEEAKYDQADGVNVVLTIDETIQYYVEKAIKKAQKSTKSEKVSCIVMDPNNGDVLAMASYPSYDPNNPNEPGEKSEKKEFNKLSSKQKGKYLNKMWKNPLTSELYEPGSVFKLVTVSSALEEGAINLNTTYNCGGSYTVAGEKIKCWYYPNGHGHQNTKVAVGNSCNPSMMQIIQKMGYSKFYQYLELYGITEKTGIDYPGEEDPLIQSKEVAGSVGLATMSFGQGLSITPIQMISAVSAIGNEGKLMQPRLVKALADDNGNVVKEFSTKVVRQVISKKTSEEMKGIMEYVVDKAGGSVAQVAGYSVGGKTGTSQKIINGQYSSGKVMGSMVSMAPMDDPEFVVLVVADEPKVGEFGSSTAGPAVQEITAEVLRYLNVKPSYTDEERAKMQKSQIIVPKVVGSKYSEAKSILSESGLKGKAPEGTSTKKDYKVVDQYPKAGTYVKKGTEIYLYKN